jgi:hypothetical protein
MKKASNRKAQAPAATTPAKKTASTKHAPVVNQARIDAEDPIPLKNGGMAFSFVSGVPYLPFLPPRDNYAFDLFEARMSSVTHNACISTKKDYCAGIGFQDADNQELDQRISDWFRSMNLKNEPCTEINQQIFESFFTQGNAPIEVVKFTVRGKKYVFVYPHSLLEWRLGEPNSDDMVTYGIQSKLFRRDGYVTADQLKNARKLPIYSPYNTDKNNWFTDETGAQRTLIWYKNSVKDVPHYGLPSAIAAMIYQILEYKGARYNLDNFENNMVAAAILALKGNLSQTEANRIGRQIINAHTGDGKRGRTVVVASEEGIDSSSLHNLDTTKDGSYIDADDKWTQKIILANEWDAVLAGLIAPSTLGKGSGFLTKIIEYKERTVIKPAQNRLMQNVWNTIFPIAQAWMGLPLDRYNMQIKNNIDISGLTDVDITPAVQVNEVRKAKGLPEDPQKEGVYMTQMKTVQQQPEGGNNVPG